MLELVATVLLLLWVAALVTGFATGLGVHVLLAGACIALLLHHREMARLRAEHRVEPRDVLLVGGGRAPRARSASSSQAPKRPSAAA